MNGACLGSTFVLLGGAPAAKPYTCRLSLLGDLTDFKEKMPSEAASFNAMSFP